MSKRDFSGLVLLDKSPDMSSNQALQTVKRLFKAKKAGHTGSLDPIATGVLPLCFGEATKFAQFGLDAVKGYRVVAQLGIATETGDRTGRHVSQQAVPEFNHSSQFIDIIQQFIGIQAQTPSIYSALKYNGKPLYEYARQGILDVPRPTRKICIASIEIIQQPNDKGCFVLDVICSKGTYIRTLVEDIGEQLKCGAHVLELHRTRAGVFTDNHSHSLDIIHGQLNYGASQYKKTGKNTEINKLFIPVSSFLVKYPWFLVNETARQSLEFGHKIQCSDVTSIDFVKNQLPEFVLKSYNLPPVMNEFLQAQTNTDNLESLPIVLFSELNSHQANAQKKYNFNNIRLRGLAYKKEQTFQPKRLVNNKQIFV